MKAVILGANSEIARKFCEICARNSWELFLASRNISELERFVKHIETVYGVRSKYSEFDALDYESHKPFWNKVIKEFGDVDVVLVAFGYFGNQEKALKDFEEARRIIETNYLGAVSIINIVANYMADRGRGVIVGISSVAGDRGRAKNVIYGSSKSAFSEYLSGLRAKMFSKGVKVITVKPGFVDTPMTKGLKVPKVLLASPEKVAMDIYKAVLRGKDIVYTPFYWRYIMCIVKAIPEFMFKRTRF